MKGKRILIVDSDAETARKLSMRLREEDYAVSVRADGVQGTRSALDDKPDLIIAQLNLPCGGAVHIQEQLQVRGDYATPMVCLAANADEKQIEEARRSGLAVVHHAPSDIESLMDDIHAHLTNPAHGRSETVGDRRRMLIVDDEMEHCDLIQAAIEGGDVGSWTFVRAHTVEDACRLVAEAKFGCILLDHNLPDGHGSDVLRRMEDRLLTTPVIGLSTSPDPEVALDEFRGGCIDFIRKRDAFTGDVLRKRVASAMAKCNRRMIATMIERRELAGAMETSQDSLIKEARCDALTGVWNRRAFDDYLTAVDSNARSSEGAYALVMADVDNFKKYNDTYGHAAGDEVLIAVAGAMAHAVRAPDFLARYGGEEFVVVCEKVSTRAMIGVAERLCDAVSRLGIPHQKNAGYGVVTISLGIASFDAAIDNTSVELLKRADAALYQAKTGGRNTFRVAQVSECSEGIHV